MAELARLIGRDDPFADLRRDSGQAAARSEPASAPRKDPMAPDWLGRQRVGQERPGRDVAAGPIDPRADPADDAQWRANRHRDQFGREEPPQQYADDPGEPQQSPDHAGPRYQHAAYDGHPDAAPPVADDYETETDYAEEYVPTEGEEAYEAPRPRRGGLMTVAAALGLVVLLVGGAFGYRALSARLGSNGQPPVIVADPTPTKVVPPVQSAEGQPSKLINDRVPDKSQASGEPVTREEQPVDPRGVAPRVIPLPGPVTAAPAPSAPVVGAPAAAPVAANIAAANEPKKVKTQTIRPDQTASADGADTSSSWPAPPAVRSVTTTTVPGQPSTRSLQRPAAPAGATPLVIGPQTAPAEANDAARAPPARVATVTPPAAQPVRAPEAGGYVVQLFSGKSETEAQDQFRALQGKYQNVLGGRQPIIRRADLGEKGVYYRAQVGPFATIDLANQFCGNLKTAGGQCIVQRN